MTPQICDHCRQPIHDRGVVYVLHADVLAAEESGNHRDWEPAQWRSTHLDCHPDPEGPNGYAIDANQLTTHADFLWWTAHLMGKNWLGATDWADFITRAANDQGDRNE